MNQQVTQTVHWVRPDGQVACGADGPESLGTDRIYSVTCPDCKRAPASSYAYPGSDTWINVSSFNGLASWSLVFGLLWGFGFFSLFAIIFGHIALRQIKVRHQDGRPVALLGLVLGYVGFLVPTVFWLTVFVQTMAL